VAADAPADEAAEDAREDVHEEPVELLHGAVVTRRGGQAVVHPDRADYVKLVKALHADGYLMCVDLTAVDYLTYADRPLPAEVAPERFEIVASFINHTTRERVRLRVQVPEDDAQVPSLFELYPGTEALEREVFDMYGIDFAGHPDMTRILMPEDWVGHPLRKDYNSGRIPVQFKQAPAGR
jgi:NADH-quinone oxidoreductase subunit C